MTYEIQKIEKEYVQHYQELVDCSSLVKAGKYIPDTYYVKNTVFVALMKVKSILRQRFPAKIDNFYKIPVNSCFRYPFTVLFGNKIDYPDMTDCRGHWTGLAIDFDFVSFTAQTGIDAKHLLMALNDAGFEQNLKNKGVPNEDHHLTLMK